MRCSRTNGKRNPLGPMYAPRGIDIMGVLDALGIKYEIDPMDKLIDCGEVVEVKPMELPQSLLFSIEATYPKPKKASKKAPKRRRK